MKPIKLPVMAIILSTFWSFSPLQAQEDDVINFREKCRRTISGFYSNILGDQRMAEDSVIQARQFKSKSQKLIDEHERKLRSLNKKLQSKDYTPEMISERDYLTSQIKMHHEQLLASENQILEAEKRRKATRVKEQALSSKVTSIFKVFFAEDPDGGPHPIYNKIEWKSPCPQYRALCPLPERDREILKSLIKDIDDLQSSCHRYSQLK